MHIVSELSLRKGADKTCFSCVRMPQQQHSDHRSFKEPIDINVCIKVNDMINKEVDKCIYFGNETNCGKMVGESDRRIQNSSKFCQSMKELLLNRDSKVVQNNNI
jgi:hypothetical protein